MYFSRNGFKLRDELEVNVRSHSKKHRSHVPIINIHVCPVLLVCSLDLRTTSMIADSIRGFLFLFDACMLGADVFFLYSATEIDDPTDDLQRPLTVDSAVLPKRLKDRLTLAKSLNMHFTLKHPHQLTDAKTVRNMTEILQLLCLKNDLFKRK